MRLIVFALAIIAVVVPNIVLAEGGAEPQFYIVYRGSLPVLKIINRPGSLTSTALPAPGTKPASHPFLTASALAAGEEFRLRGILDASANWNDFLKNLRRVGYVIKPQSQRK